MLEEQLQKKLADPGLGFNERMQLQQKLTNLSLQWQESGIVNIEVLRALREAHLQLLRTLGQIDPATREYHSKDHLARVAELDKLIAEGERKGMA